MVWLQTIDIETLEIILRRHDRDWGGRIDPRRRQRRADRIATSGVGWLVGAAVSGEQAQSRPTLIRSGPAH